MSVLDFVFRKGRMGRTISREETVELINPLVEQHFRLNRAYEFAIRELSDRDIAEQLNATQKIARADVGKLKETVFSCGGSAYNGTDLSEDDFDLGDSDSEILTELRDREQAFLDALEEQQDVTHQMRTRAILAVVRTNSSNRLHDLKGVLQSRRPVKRHN